MFNRMKNKLLITTAIVGLGMATNAQALSLGDWVLPGNDSNLNEEYTITDQEDTTANSITIKDNATLNMTGTKVDISKNFNLDDTATLNMGTSEITASEINTTGGVANLTGGNNISAGSMNFKNSELNFSGDTNTLKSALVNFENMTVNVKDAGAFALNGAKQTLNAAGNNTFNTKDGGIELKNATLNIQDNASFSIVDTSADEAKKGSLVVDASLDKDDFATTINNSGTISADVSGNGIVNFLTSNAKVDGNVGKGDTNIYFKDNHTLSSAITGDINVAQMMIDHNGSLIADKTFTANDLVIGSKNGRSGTGSLDLLADASVAGAKVNSGSVLNLGDNKLTVTGGHIQGNDYVRLMDGSTLAFNFGKGQIIGDVNLEGKVNLNPTIAIGTEDGTHQFITGEITKEDKTINDSEFDEENIGWTGYENNNLYDISLSEDEKSMIIAKKNQDDMAAATGANANQASVIAAITSCLSENATFNAAANNINALAQSSDKNDVKAATDAATALAPEVAPMVQHTQTQTTNQVFAAVGTRLTGGSISTGGQGMASGDNIFERASLWVQGLFNKSKLDDTASAKGFDSDSTGMAIGAEKHINDNTKVGLGYAYTNTDIDGFMRSTDVDTHTAFVYGEYKPSNWYVNGVASYGWSDYSEDKNVLGVGVKSDYDVETVGLQAMTGYDMQMKNFSLTPEVGLRYVHISQDGYTDSAGQKVSSENSDILTGVIGAKVSKNFALENGMNLKPEARIAATYDLMNDDTNSVVTLANGSAYAVEGDALDRFGMEFGAGLTAEVDNNVELSLGYEGKVRQDYQDHTGLLNAKYNF